MTQVKWSTRCALVVAAGRRDKALSVWDVRMGGGQPLLSLQRDNCTNQRVLFDISTCGRYIITPHHSDAAATSHTIRVFDLVTGQLETEVALPTGAFPNAVALSAPFTHPPSPLVFSCLIERRRHPSAPMFAVATGQRLYRLPSSSSSSSSSVGSGSSDDETEAAAACDDRQLEAALLLFRGSFN